MASYTPNYNLKKPADADTYDIADANGNMDILDSTLHSQNEAVANVQNGLAYIVGNTNTTGGMLSIGQFVYVKGHSTIAEGLRHVTADIGAGGNITTNNTSACSGGGFNALNNQISHIETNGYYTSSETTWDAAIENYVDSLPNDGKTHIGFVQRSGAGIVMCIIQKISNGGYAAVLSFGYWREPYYYTKNDGVWTAKKITLNT